MSTSPVGSPMRARSATATLLTALVASSAVMAAPAPSNAGQAIGSRAAVPAEHVDACAAASMLPRLDAASVSPLDSRVTPVAGQLGSVQVTEASYRLPDGRFCDVAVATSGIAASERYVIDGAFTRASVVTAEGQATDLGDQHDTEVTGTLTGTDSLLLGAVAYKPVATGVLGTEPGVDSSLRGKMYTQATTAGYDIDLEAEVAKNVTLPPTPEQKEEAGAKRDARIEAAETKLDADTAASKATRTKAAKRARVARATAMKATRAAVARLQLDKPEARQLVVRRDAAAALRMKKKILNTWKRHHRRVEAAVRAHKVEIDAARAEYRSAGTVVQEWVKAPVRAVAVSSTFNHVDSMYGANHQVGGVITSALSVPLSVSSGVTSVAAGDDHTLALKDDGSVVAWGKNGHGQLDVPADLGRAVAVAAGGNRSYVVLADGTVRAWGEPGEALNVPAGLDHVKKLVAYYHGAIALKDDGTLVGWGMAGSGGLAIPAGLTDIVDVGVGQQWGIALSADGTATGWGSSNTWEDGSTAPLTDVVKIGVADQNAYAITSDGVGHTWNNSPASWGTMPADVAAQVDNIEQVFVGGTEAGAVLKDGTVRRWSSSAPDIKVPTDWMIGVKQATAGSYHVAAVMKDGSVKVTGLMLLDPTAAPADLDQAVQVDGGEYFGVARYRNGTVKAWLSDPYGDYGQTDVPADLTDVVDIDAGREHVLALKSDGTVVAWGANWDGESTVPAGLSDVVEIEAGAGFSLARKADGTIVSWGYNGNNRATVPAGLNDVVQMDSTAGFTLVRHSDGTVSGWGVNWYGQTVAPAGLTDVVDIAAGAGHSLALKSDGTVVAWGANYAGQNDLPADLNGVTDVEAGNNWSVMLKSDGTVVTVGNNGYGQRALPDTLPPVESITAGYENWWFTPRATR